MLVPLLLTLQGHPASQEEAGQKGKGKPDAVTLALGHHLCSHSACVTTQLCATTEAFCTEAFFGTRLWVWLKG